MPCVKERETLIEATRAASKYSSVQIVMVDIDENDGLKTKYEITSIPTVIRFKKGAQADRYVGPLVVCTIRRRTS